MRKKCVFFAKKEEKMKKVKLLDKFRLTDRFMEGRISLLVDMAVDAEGKDGVVRDGRYFEFSDGERVHCRFTEGDCPVVMMSYEKAGLDRNIFGNSKGWHNKLAADALYMPHKMVIEGVRCVRVQDLTEEEVLRAGVTKNRGGLYLVGGDCGGLEEDWRLMYARLFDKMFKAPYALNPWVIVYDVTPVIARADVQG